MTAALDSPIFDRPLPDLAAPRPAINPWIVAITVTLATFMEVLDTSIANVSLPHIAGNLSASIDESTWILTTYLVSNAIVLPLSGWLSSVLGRKRFYMTCVALFTISSVLCGFASSLGMLVFCRVLQGMGGGGLQPSEQSILADTFPPAKRGMAFAVYGIAVVTAPALGPTLGGWITDNFTWRWIFFINVPVGIISLLATSRFVHDPPHLRKAAQRVRKSGVDFFGLGLITVGLGCLQVVLDKGQTEDWFGSHLILWLTIICVTALVTAIIWEWRSKNPIVDIRLLRDRNFATANLMMFLLGFVMMGSTVLLPTMLQDLLGYTAMQSGMCLSPGAVGIMLCMPVVGILLTKQLMQPRTMIAFGLFVSATGLWMMTNFNLQLDFNTAMIDRVVQSLGLAFLFVPINVSAYAYLPMEKNNNASGLINLSRNIGGSVGIAFAVMLLERRTQAHLVQLIGHMTDYDQGFRAALHSAADIFHHAGFAIPDAAARAYGQLYGMAIRQANMLGFIDVVQVLAIFFYALIPFALLMKKPKHGAAMAAH